MANRALDWVGMPKQGGKGPLEQEKEREEVLNYKDSTLSWRWGTARSKKKKKKALRSRIVICNVSFQNSQLRGSHAVK